MSERADLIKLYVSNGVTSLNDIKKDYNSFGDGGDIWEKTDKIVEKAEPWVSGASLALLGTTVVAPEAGIVTIPAMYVTNTAGTLMDGYQAVRDFQNGDYTSGVWNGIEALAGAFGGKVATKLARTTGGRAIGKLKEQLARERFNSSGDSITRLMRKGLTYEQAAERVMQNAVNYVDNSGKVKDTVKGIRDYYDRRFDNGAGIVDAVFDAKDVGNGVYSGFKEEHPVEVYKRGGKLNIFDTGGPIQTALDTDLKGYSYFENVLNSIDQTSDQEALKEATEVDHRLKIRFKVPNDTPEAVYVSKVNNLVKEKSKEEIIKDLKTKSEDEIKEIQKQLGDEGYYDFELSTGKSNNASTVQKQLVKEGYLTNKEVDSNVGSITTTALQTMLVDKGYLSRYTQDGKDNIDGILGKRTREAYKQYNRDFNIDGKVGNKTINSFLKSKEKEIKGFDTYVSAEGMVDQCAKWVATKYDTITGVGKQNGVHGNAWNMLTNIEDAGGKMLFNIYDDAVFDNVSTPSQVKQATQQALKNSNIDYSKLIEGDVVGIYIPSSTHYSEVLKSGTTYNTHVGIIVDVENGIPIVEHNILGKVRRERIDKLSGSVYGKPTVTVASRPKTGEQVQQLEFKDIKSKYILPEGKENSLMREYMDSLASAKETFKRVFDNVDLDFIEEAAIAITKRETDFMNNKPSDNRFKPSFIATNIVHQLKNTPQDIISQDLTKMKFNSLNSTYRASIGLSSPEQLSNDPTITGRAVMLLLSKNYDYFTRLAKQNPELGLTKEDIENATILSYNRGIGATHTLGFNKDGSLNVEELKYLRESSKLDAKEKDISSTKLKHVKLLGEKAGQLAEWYYDKYGEPHTPYVSRARQTMLTLQKK